MKRFDPMFWFGVSFLTLLVLVAVFGPMGSAGHNAIVADPYLGPSAQHWMGTDELGRDIFKRIAYGARLSLMIGLSVQALSLLIGITAGMIGSFGPKWLRVMVLRFTDGMFAFPDILLAILIIGVWKTGVEPVIVALAVTSWPGITRLVVTQVASLRDREYVVASNAMGASTPYVVIRHILPQMWGVLLAVAMVDLAGTILAESTLSFLGIGVQAPDPSWGSMIEKGRFEMTSNPMLLLWPCLVLSTTIFALNFVGDGIRAALDPRRKS
ncbi:MAG: ABC transporter permease [Armatimonadetes bacterium]|uniref:Peptide ABC transporter permease n=1 Tax=Candidatus Nitrosymbiomonas proteolyticus TaxID=2608984 RepID=A0A809RJR6_9BACT|nr:ABC transporter permease [Armatimonadota bacterium]MBV6490259.1 Oligopeptide transport system permease protein OppC [Fimbriimonadaceae bacterium]QOJ12853.1 MAG: ABC transporter permease [Chthonomonadaceae bacterium]BBO24765.1 peptide ABC transporter permease [Candidatus Nitrosymbiomonas proteolyticus]MCK6632003.1 ABC transporter permease [Fimbriimonadaceae bacterium]